MSATEPIISTDRGASVLLTASEAAERRERLRALLPVVMPGPWRWFGHRGSSMILATVHDGICTVMGAARKGMQLGQFTFFDRGTELRRGWNGRYKTATDVAVQECHYRDDIVDMDNPQARWLASADPLTVGELFADYDALEAENVALRAVEVAARVIAAPDIEPCSCGGNPRCPWVILASALAALDAARVNQNQHPGVTGEMSTTFDTDTTSPKDRLTTPKLGDGEAP